MDRIYLADLERQWQTNRDRTIRRGIEAAARNYAKTFGYKVAIAPYGFMLHRIP